MSSVEVYFLTIIFNVFLISIVPSALHSFKILLSTSQMSHWDLSPNSCDRCWPPSKKLLSYWQPKCFHGKTSYSQALTSGWIRWKNFFEHESFVLLGKERTFPSSSGLKLDKKVMMSQEKRGLTPKSKDFWKFKKSHTLL